MSIKAFPELPDRGPGLKDVATDEQWDVLAKDAVATIHCEPDACDECAPWDGEQMRLPEAEEKVPFHFNCRCSWTYDWRPELSSLPMTSLLTRASGRSSETMTDTVTKTAVAESVVDKTPNGEDDGEYLKVPISSTDTDRDGDRFSDRGLKNLRDQISETSRPVFGDHGMSDGGLFSPRYGWKSIIGSQDDVDIEEDGDEKTLYSYINPNSENPEGEGELLASYVKEGMPVGFSIGFRPLDKDGDSDDGFVFHETDLLETSAVGIQSNQQSVAGRGATDSAAVLAKGVADGLPDANLDEETLARAIVSEAFARGSGTEPNAGEPFDVRQQTAGPTTKDTTMSDSDSDDTYVTEQQLEEKLDEHQNDLIKGIAAELDGSLGEDDPDGEEKGGDDVDPELKELAEQNAENIADLKDAVEDGDPEDAETANKATDPDSDDEGGEEPGGEKDTEPTTEKDTVGEDAEGWM